MNSHSLPQRRSKAGYYWLEGMNSLAASYFFGGLTFLLHKEFNLPTQWLMAVGAGHGFLYVGGSLLAGHFAQTRGNFASLRVGFIGMGLSVALGGLVPSFGGQLLALACWTLTMCFTWVALEALVSEGEDRVSLARRTGLYNVVWALTAAIGYFACGWVFEKLGRASLYWLPSLIHLIQAIVAAVLRRGYRRPIPPIRETSTQPDALAKPEVNCVRAADFLRLAWMANPFTYMAINTVILASPLMADRVGLDRSQATMVMALWYWMRALSFVVLWHWRGWHYRFGWFVSALACVGGGFIGFFLGTSIWQLLLAQVVFGWGTAVMYYSSFFYAMDGTETHAEHGGSHEALIGAGIGGGPAISSLSLVATQGQPLAPAWAMGSLLVLALGWVIYTRQRQRARDTLGLSTNHT